MSLVYLIRHGDTDYIGRALTSWRPGVLLNQRGREQAARLVTRLAGVRFSAIYSSPLERARMTAQPLAQALGFEIQDCPDVGEFRFGDWTGKTLAELETDPLWQRFNRLRATTAAPNGELMAEVQARMARTLEGLRHRHPSETVAVFSHADAIRAAVLHYLGITADLIDRIEISPASVTIFRLEDWGSQILRLNDNGEWP